MHASSNSIEKQYDQEYKVVNGDRLKSAKAYIIYTVGKQKLKFINLFASWPNFREISLFKSEWKSHR